MSIGFCPIGLQRAKMHRLLLSILGGQCGRRQHDDNAPSQLPLVPNILDSDVLLGCFVDGSLWVNDPSTTPTRIFESFFDVFVIF